MLQPDILVNQDQMIMNLNLLQSFLTSMGIAIQGLLLWGLLRLMRVLTDYSASALT